MFFGEKIDCPLPNKMFKVNFSYSLSKWQGVCQVLKIRLLTVFYEEKCGSG